MADQSIDLSEYQVARFTYFHVDDPLRNTTGDKMLIRVGQTVLNGTEPVDSGRSYLQLGGNNMLTTWAVVWPVMTGVMKFLSYAGVAIVAVVLLMIPQLQYRADKEGYFMMTEDYEAYKELKAKRMAGN